MLWSDTSFCVSCVLSEMLSKLLKYLSDGGIIKECLEEVANVVFPDKRHIISKFVLSGLTVWSRIADISIKVKENLKMKSANLIGFM